MPGKKLKKLLLTRKGPEYQEKKTQLTTPKSIKWTGESMLGAIKAASEGMGINRAAIEFGVPKTTLKDRISGRVICQ